MEVRVAVPDDRRVHSFHWLTLSKRLAKLRRDATDTRRLCLVQIAEVINVALRRHEEVPEKGPRISVERGQVKGANELFVHERPARNLDVPRDLTTDEAARIGHTRSVVDRLAKPRLIPPRKLRPGPGLPAAGAGASREGGGRSRTCEWRRRDRVEAWRAAGAW